MIEKATVHHVLGPALHSAHVDQLFPIVDALDRAAHMRAVADGQRPNALGSRERGEQRDRAADRFADQMESIRAGGVSDLEDVVGQQIERQLRVRRRMTGAAMAPHIERTRRSRSASVGNQPAQVPLVAPSP
jgi:hypothetical protein